MTSSMAIINYKNKALSTKSTNATAARLGCGSLNSNAVEWESLKQRLLDEETNGKAYVPWAFTGQQPEESDNNEEAAYTASLQKAIARAA